MNFCKFLSAVIFVGCSLVNTDAQTCATAPIGLVAAYSGDNNALDARSRSNGAIQNGVTYAAGNVGQAFQLGGAGNASNSGDRVIVGNPANLRLQSFTFEAWVKRSSSTIVTNSPVAGFAGGTFFAFGQSGWGVIIDQPTNKLAFTQIGVNNIQSNFTITDTNWHHVAASISGTQAVFYLDGVADTPINYAITFVFTTNAAIGARGDSDARNAFFGAVDELGIYNRVLSASEVQAIFNAGTIGKCKPLATYAPENQVLWLAGDGDANDLSGNGNNGTLQSGASYAVGKVGQGFQFNGSGFVSVADAPSLNPTAQVSIEGWVYPTTDSISPSPMAIILNKETNATIQFEMARRLSSGNCPTGGGIPTGNFAVYIGGISGLPDDCGGWVNSNAPLPLNTWSHIAMTYDGTNLRAFVNGANTRTVAATGAIPTTNGILQLGKRVMNTETWIGQMDEMSVSNRSLTTAEIESIANAGLAGKYKVQSTVPTGLIAWFAGDGNANDISGNGNNATANGGVTYNVGKVGQAIRFDGTSGFVKANASSSLNVGASSGMTIETWFNPASTATQSPIVEWNTGSSVGTHFWSSVTSQGGVAGNLYVNLTDTGGSNHILQSGAVVTANTFQHVAVTYDKTTGNAVLYCNGAIVAQQNLGIFTPRTSYDLYLAHRPGGGPAVVYAQGSLDEVSIYSRALSPSEIRDQFYAGSGGKYKGAINPTVSNTTKTGEATVTFGTITTTGAVHLTPINSASFPALPMGTNTGLNFDVSTTAVYTNPTVCFNMSAYTPAQFANLRIFHLESGAWINRTAGANTYPNLCTSGLTSLSPFAIAQVAPVAANVSIVGRVLVGKDVGLRNAFVTLTDAAGNVRTVRTSAFGYYRFDDIEVGQTVILSVVSKRFQFATQVVSVSEDLTELNFTAEP